VLLLALKFPSPARFHRAGLFVLRCAMALPAHFYRDPCDVLEAKQQSEIRSKRAREEAIADIASIYKRPIITIRREEKPRRSLEEFLAGESAPVERSEAWKQAESLFQP
jgi:hypothetical protein